MSKLSLTCYLIISLLGLCVMVAAEEVFKWQDSAGVTHYSTDKQKGARNKGSAAQLPKITKTKASAAPEPLSSCRAHGGIDCAVGRDSDGSVICSDGYKDSATRFLFRCRETKLKLAEIINVDDATGQIRVLVKNVRGVDAKDVLVKYRLRPTEPFVAVADGPQKIAAFSIGEYLIPALIFIADGTEASAENINFSCENCLLQD